MTVDDTNSTNLAPIVLTIAELAELLAGQYIGPESGVDQSVAIGPLQVTVHSELVKPGGIFFALTSKRDGHDWVHDAFSHGAACAVVERDVTAISDGTYAGPQIVVNDSLSALQTLATWYRTKLDCHMVAIAGSIGKTTTKDAIVDLIGNNVTVFGTPGSQNSQIGVPLAVLACPREAEYAFIEHAATEPGEMARIAAITKPDTVVITSLASRFGKNFATTQAYVSEICEIANYVQPEGRVICGNDQTQISAELNSRSELKCTVAGPQSDNWPLADMQRRANSQYLLTSTPEIENGFEIWVESTSFWTADQVSLAAATLHYLGLEITDTTISPLVLDFQTWRSPKGVLVLRVACVDEPMTWMTAIADAKAAVDHGGRVLFVASDTVANLSKNTLRIASRQLTRNGTVLTYDRNVARLLSDMGAAEVVACDSGLIQDLALKQRSADLDKDAKIILFGTADELANFMLTETRLGDVVAIFSPRGDTLESPSQDVLDAIAPTRLYVDLNAMAFNVQAIRRQVGATKIMAVVKGGAYGADGPGVARHLANFGVDEFAVSNTDEGVALRRAGVTEPILVLLPTPEEITKAYNFELEVCAHSQTLLEAINEAGPGPVGVHLELDSGMHRTGIDPADVVPSLELLTSSGFEVAGLMTHMAGADEKPLDAFTQSQLLTFDNVCAAISEAGLEVPPRHCLNSAGLMRFVSHKYEIVRPGLMLQGLAPSEHCDQFELAPALTLVTKLIDIRHLKAGDCVGYGCTFVASEPTIAGVVQMGYHDGILRSFGKSGTVVIEGLTCPVLGRVSMDSMVVDITNCADAEVGSDVVFFGARGKSSQPVETVAAAVDTITWEIVSRLGDRIQRIYTRY